MSVCRATLNRRLLSSSLCPFCTPRRESLVFQRAYATVKARQVKARDYKARSPRGLETPGKNGAKTASKTGPPALVRKPKSIAPPSPPPPPPESLPEDLCLNPPRSTRSPPLNLPVRDASVPRYKHLYRTAKAYMQFYKAGFISIYRNYKLVRRFPNYPHRNSPLLTRRRTIYTSADLGQLTRSELQTILRTRADIKFMPLFLLMWCVCGEFTPVIVPFVTPIIPRTLWIPVQIRNRRRMVGTKQEIARKEGHEMYSDVRSIWQMSPKAFRGVDHNVALQRLGIELGLHARSFGDLFRKWTIPRRLKRKLLELRCDDMLMLKEGNAHRRLLPDEVTLALDERGIPVEGRSEKEQRADLQQWLEDRNGDTAQQLVDFIFEKPQQWRYVPPTSSADQAEVPNAR